VAIVGDDPLLAGLLGGLVIATMNVIGALSILVVRDPSERQLDGALGFAAGGMLFVISHEIVPQTHAGATSTSPPPG